MQHVNRPISLNYQLCYNIKHFSIVQYIFLVLIVVNSNRLSKQVGISYLKSFLIQDFKERHREKKKDVGSMFQHQLFKCVFWCFDSFNLKKYLFCSFIIKLQVWMTSTPDQILKETNIHIFYSGLVLKKNHCNSAKNQPFNFS